MSITDVRINDRFLSDQFNAIKKGYPDLPNVLIHLIQSYTCSFFIQQSLRFKELPNLKGRAFIVDGLHEEQTIYQHDQQTKRINVFDVERGRLSVIVDDVNPPTKIVRKNQDSFYFADRDSIICYTFIGTDHLFLSKFVLLRKRSNSNYNLMYHPKSDHLIAWIGRTLIPFQQDRVMGILHLPGDCPMQSLQLYNVNKFFNVVIHYGFLAEGRHLPSINFALLIPSRENQLKKIEALTVESYCMAATCDPLEESLFLLMLHKKSLVLSLLELSLPHLTLKKSVQAITTLSTMNEIVCCINANSMVLGYCISQLNENKTSTTLLDISSFHHLVTFTISNSSMYSSIAPFRIGGNSILMGIHRNNVTPNLALLSFEDLSKK